MWRKKSSLLLKKHALAGPPPPFFFFNLTLVGEKVACAAPQANITSLSVARDFYNCGHPLDSANIESDPTVGVGTLPYPFQGSTSWFVKV